MRVQIIADKNGRVLYPNVVLCKDCLYFKPFKDATGYGNCQSNHTFDGAFRESDFCSYAKEKKPE